MFKTSDISLRSFDDASKLLCEHHIPFDLQLASHKGLHAIELALGHSDHVCICNCDSAICLWIFSDSCRPSSVLEVLSELALGPSVADDELKHCAAELYEVSAF